MPPADGPEPDINSGSVRFVFSWQRFGIGIGMEEFIARVRRQAVYVTSSLLSLGLAERYLIFRLSSST